jgi:hypothetical protein
MVTIVPRFATFGGELSQFGVSSNGATFSNDLDVLTPNQVHSTIEASILFVHKVSTRRCTNNTSYMLNGIHMTGKMYRVEHGTMKGPRWLEGGE